MKTIDFIQHIRSTPAEIWDAIFRKDKMEIWLKTTNSEMPTEVGAKFFWEHRFNSEQSHRYGGTVIDLEYPRRIQLSWELTEYDYYPTNVTLELKESFYGADKDYDNRGTDLHLIHSGIPEEGTALHEFDGHSRHWRQAIGELAAFVEGRPGKPRPGAIAGLIFVGGAHGRGLLVRDVIVGSPAFDVGIRRGDQVMEVAGRKMGSVDDFHDWVDFVGPGETAQFMLADRAVLLTLVSPEAVVTDEQLIETHVGGR